MRRGDFALLDCSEAADPDMRTVIAFSRSLDGVTLHCAINLGSAPARLQNTAWFKGETLLGGLDGDTLPPFGCVVTVR